MGTPSQRLLQAQCRQVPLLCKTLPPLTPITSPCKLRSDLSPSLAPLILKFLATGTANCCKLYAALMSRMLILWGWGREHETRFWGWEHPHQLKVVGHYTAVLSTFLPNNVGPRGGEGASMNELPLVQIPHSWIWSPEKAFWYFLVGSDIIVSSSCSTVYISIHAEYLLNELHFTGGRRVEWLNTRTSESDSWVQSCFYTRLPVMLGTLMKGSAPPFPHLTPIMIITTSDAYKTFNTVPSAQEEVLCKC